MGCCGIKWGTPRLRRSVGSSGATAVLQIQYHFSVGIRKVPQCTDSSLFIDQNSQVAYFRKYRIWRSRFSNYLPSEKKHDNRIRKP